MKTYIIIYNIVLDLYKSKFVKYTKATVILFL